MTFQSGDITNRDLPFPMNRLRYARQCCNLTQQELADRVGLSQAMISNYELGITGRVRPELRRSISRALQISHNWLFDKDGYLRP